MDISADALATRANVVIQVDRSHLERTEEFLRTHYGANGDHDDAKTDKHVADATQNKGITSETPVVEIVSTKRVIFSKTCSLIFIHTSDPSAFIEHVLNKHKFVLQAMHKLYIMTSERSAVKGIFTPIKQGGDTLSNESIQKSSDDSCDMSHYLFKLLQKVHRENCNTTTNNDNNLPRCTKVALQVFPSRLQRQIVTNLTALLDANSIPEEDLDISPANQTHTLSIVQIDNGTNIKTAKDNSGIFLVGISPIEQSAPAMHTAPNSDHICRAYYKLSEAFERYQYQNNYVAGETTPSFSFSTLVGSGSKRKNGNSKPIIAVDCGAAPGGWSKYLIEQTACDKVYSIDPGEMDSTITSFPNVHHMKMTAAMAIPQLQSTLSEQDNAVALWVSDMCVQDIPKQVDVFLLAKKSGMFQPDAAFVLTIKCNVGHGKERFDQLAKNQAERLGCAYGVQIIHLFSNRVGERTIVGFIK